MDRTHAWKLRNGWRARTAGLRALSAPRLSRWNSIQGGTACAGCSSSWSLFYRRHTSTPDDCWFAIWEGYGFDTSATLLAAIRRTAWRTGNWSVNVSAFKRTTLDGTTRSERLLSSPSQVRPAEPPLLPPLWRHHRRVEDRAPRRQLPAATRPLVASGPTMVHRRRYRSRLVLHRVDLSDSSLQWRQSSRARYGEWTGRRRTPQPASRDRSRRSTTTTRVSRRFARPQAVWPSPAGQRNPACRTAACRAHARSTDPCAPMHDSERHHATAPWPHPTPTVCVLARCLIQSPAFRQQIGERHWRRRGAE